MSTPRDYRPARRLAIALAVLQLALSIGFIWRSSYIVEGRRYFALFDDALISLRYAENLTAGNGLVWNPGERIEGYTNLLWTLVLAGVHALPLDRSGVCLAIQILGIPLLWTCLWSTVRLAQTCRLLPAGACCALLLTALHYNLIFFSLMGMETALLTAVLTAGLTASVAALQMRTGSLATSPWYALAVLCRLDALVVVAFAYGLELICVRRGRVKTIAAGAIVAAVPAGHFLWRHAYYGEWLPNTYYLKATGWPLGERLLTGLEQSTWIGMAFGLPLLLALLTLLRPRRRFVLLLGSFGALLAYHVYVGGDAWPLNRFVIPASIALFVAAAQGLNVVYRTLISTRTRAKSIAFYGSFVAVCLLALDGVHLEHLLLIEPPQTVRENRMNTRFVRAIEQIASPDARVAVVYAGVVPYFSARPAIDLYGKCDREIARLPAIPGIRRAGHNKFDFRWSLQTYRPDIVLHVFPARDPAVRESYRPIAVEIDAETMLLLVRNATPHVRAGRTVTWEDAERMHAKLYGRDAVAIAPR